MQRLALFSKHLATFCRYLVPFSGYLATLSILFGSITAHAQKRSELGGQTQQAVETYPELLPALASAEALGSYPNYLGMSPAEYSNKMGAFRKYEKALASPRLSGDLLEILVAFFAKGDPRVAAKLRQSPVFQRAIAILINPSSDTEAVSNALSELSSLTGMNKLSLISSLETLADSNGEKLGGANSAALAANANAGRIAYFQNNPKNKLEMGAFNSAEVVAVNEDGQGTIYPPGALKTASMNGGPLGDGGYTRPGGYSNGNSAGSSGASGNGFVDPTGGQGVLFAPNSGAGRMSAQNMGADRMKIPVHSGDGSMPSSYTPMKASGETVAAATTAKAAPNVAQAYDPMMSVFGGDFSRPENFAKLGDDGKPIPFTPRIAKDFATCRGLVEKKKGNAPPLRELCESSKACSETQECECYREFNRSMSQAAKTSVVKDKTAKKECSLVDKGLCSGEVQAIRIGHVGDPLNQLFGTMEMETAAVAGTGYKLKTTNLIKEMSDWVDSPEVTKNGRTYGPTERLSLLMNVLAGTNRGLCLLANGKKELPFGKNELGKKPFEFYEQAQPYLEDEKLPVACAKLDSSNLSGKWASQSDRLQVMGFLYVLDQMRTTHLKVYRRIANSENVDEGKESKSFEDKMVSSSPSVENEKITARGSNALASALDPSCGSNGWLSILESAESELRPLAMKCDRDLLTTEKEYTIPHGNELLRITACKGVKKTSPLKVAAVPEKKTGSLTNRNSFMASMMMRDVATDSSGSDDGIINSEFLRDYLKTDRASSSSEFCSQVSVKYLNINKLLTRVYQGRSKGDIRDSDFCQKIKENPGGKHI
jgi:hypothetical protein